MRTWFGVMLVMGMIVAVPVSAQVTPQNLIPCGKGQVESIGKTSDGKDITGVKDECTLRDLVVLVNNINAALTILSIPTAALMFTWVGWKYLMARGNSSKTEEAKRIAWNVLLGFIFILCAFGLVAFVANALLKPEFNIFLKKN